MGRFFLKIITSIKTSILLLGVMCIFFLLGTIFPQGATIDEYIKAGGKYVGFVRTFNLLNLFSSPLFLLVSLIFLLNLVCCTVSSAHRIIKQGISSNSILSLGFHIAIVLCFAGFWLTYFYSYEGEITVPVGERKALERGLEIELLSLETEYYQKPRLQYPKDKIERWKTALGIGGRRPTFEINDNLQPKDWRARVVLYRDGKKVKEKVIEVNDPLRWGGFVFYLMGIEHRISMREGKGGSEFTVSSEKPFNIGNEIFRVSKLMMGRVFRRDGSVEEIKPYIVLSRGKADRKETKETLIIKIGEAIDIGGVSITPSKVYEDVVFSYRWDPGVPVLFVGSFLFLILLSGKVIKKLVATGFSYDEEKTI